MSTGYFRDLNLNVDDRSGIMGPSGPWVLDGSGWIVNSGGGTQVTDYMRPQSAGPAPSPMAQAAADWLLPAALFVGVLVAVAALRKG